MAIDADILGKFGRIWPRHVLALTRFLISCRQTCDGDIDLFVVLCVVGERTFSQRNARPEMTYQQWSDATAQLIKAENINAQSIAEFSGIPRETVRRKLQVLIAKGWIERDGQGFVRATAKAKSELEPLPLASLRHLTQMKATLVES